MNWVDRAIAVVAPGAAVRRCVQREWLAYYEAGRQTRTNTLKRSKGSGDRSVAKAGTSLREQARQLDENHDLVVGVLNALVNNTIGAHGVSLEPQPKLANGEIHADFAEQVATLWRQWAKAPEVTGEHDLAALERLLALSWFRDGEVFTQLLTGSVAALEHSSRVPFSLEPLESDQVPISYTVGGQVTQGIEKNSWGRPIGYWTYYGHPGDVAGFDMRMKRVPGERMLHLKHTRRIRQTRGVTALAPVLTRLDDLKNYEESERVAARIAAALSFYVKKGSPELYVPPDVSEDREFDIAPGMVFDSLQVGEDVGTFEANRPSQLLQTFRDSMLRAVAAGTGSSFSTIARNYNGTYSAQRQELVEQFINYATLTAAFVGQWKRPIYERFVDAALAAGVISLPRDLRQDSLYDAEYRGPVMPWIDPQKEANANLVQVQAGFKSRSQVIRERGGNPRDLDAEVRRERERTGDLQFTSAPGQPREPGK